MEKIYDKYKGLTITFPKKLYNKKFVLQYILEHQGKETTQVIARKLDLSERRVKQLQKEIRENKVGNQTCAMAITTGNTAVIQGDAE